MGKARVVRQEPPRQRGRAASAREAATAAVAMLTIAVAGLRLLGWLRQCRRGRSHARNARADGQIGLTNRRTATRSTTTIRRRPALPIAISSSRLWLLQFLAGLVAVGLAAAVYLTFREEQTNAIVAGTAVFVAVVAGFFTWVFPALFTEA